MIQIHSCICKARMFYNTRISKDCVYSNFLCFLGKNKCHESWTMEYSGYLMSSYHGSNAASEYVCVDENPEKRHGGHKDQNGKLFYKVEAACGSLPCPPYVNGRELTCVVCSK